MNSVLPGFLDCGFAVILLLPPGTQAAGPDTSEMPAELAALQQVVMKDQQAAPHDPHLAKALGRVHALQTYVARKNFESALHMTSEVALEDPSDAVQKALTPLTAALTQASETQQSGAVAQLQKVLNDATTAIKTKTAPADFDPILTEIETALNENRTEGSNPDREADYMQLQAASRFVREWQSYLIDEKAGNAQTAANDLRNLATTETTFMPVPRSELLDRAMKESGQAANPAMLDAKIEVHSLDDLPAAIGQLEMLQRNGNYSQEMNNLLNLMQNLRSAYLSYQDKNDAVALQQLTSNPFSMGIENGVHPIGGTSASDAQDSLRQELATLKNQLLIEIVQGLLDQPNLPPPQGDEPVSAYLLRLAAEREKAGDWTGLQQVLQVDQQATGNFNPPSWLPEDLAGIRAYLVGEKLEAAGQTLDAIRSYRQALATIGRFFPAAPPADKLKELEKKYPDLYQQALQQPIRPQNP
jgi:hypothetical protein